MDLSTGDTVVQLGWGAGARGTRPWACHVDDCHNASLPRSEREDLRPRRLVKRWSGRLVELLVSIEQPRRPLGMTDGPLFAPHC